MTGSSQKLSHESDHRLLDPIPSFAGTFRAHTGGHQFYGEWVGRAYDGQLQTGMAVINDQKTKAVNQLQQLLRKYSNQVGVINHGIVDSPVTIDSA